MIIIMIADPYLALTMNTVLSATCVSIYINVSAYIVE